MVTVGRGRITTRCSRRRAAGAGWLQQRHALAAAERERSANRSNMAT
jgi:hypothetical protein